MATGIIRPLNLTGNRSLRFFISYQRMPAENFPEEENGFVKKVSDRENFAISQIYY